jgi:phosphatidate cytidylyltransferase
MKRILSAAVFLPLFYLIVRLPPAYFSGLVALAAALGVLEFAGLAAAGGIRVNRSAGVLLVLATLYAFYEPSALAMAGVAAAGVVAIPTASLLTRRPFREALASDAVTLFAGLFLGTLFGHQVALRKLGPELGADLIFLLFLAVWGSDAVAYYVGSAWGRHKLAPELSPKKTLEGAVAGIAGGVAAAFLARIWFFGRLRVEDCVILGLALPVAGIAGDLVESMWKRGAGVKDSAVLVPGHGGILDRSDSLLFGGPILYYYYLFWMR